MAEVIAIANQKGGVGKTTTTINLGAALAKAGNRVLLVDCDPQGNMSNTLAGPDPQHTFTTLNHLMTKAMQGQSIRQGEGVMRHPEGVHFIPSNVELAGKEIEMSMMGDAQARAGVLKQVIDSQKAAYDYVLIDCGPSLGMLTVNAMTAANSIIVPVEAQYYSLAGFDQLAGTVQMVQKSTNPGLHIKGAVLTRVLDQTVLARDIASYLRREYGGALKVYQADIPSRIACAEAPSAQQTIFGYAPDSVVAQRYTSLAKEVMADGNRSKTKKARNRDAHAQPAKHPVR